EQGGAGDRDDRCHLAGDLLSARGALDNPEADHPGRHAGCDQEGQQEKGAPVESAGQPGEPRRLG
ncbi:hypothetical protein, partial [Escherichia coli]|uniref:hypothetical protein n=1 Tax=Escherichia coli TaxID=562 RepID=UPI0012FFD715